MLFAIASAADDPFADLPLFHRQTMVTSVSEPMHWFDASFLETEWAGCRVGIPVVPAREAARHEPVIGCWFPAGRRETVRPDDPDLRRHYRLAKKAVRRANRGLSKLRVAYVGTWKEVHVVDLVPVPAAHTPHADRLYWWGRIAYAVTDQGIEPVRTAGVVGVGGRGVPPRIDEPWYLPVHPPSELAGTSVLLAVGHMPDDEQLQSSERAIRQSVQEHLPDIEAGEPSPPPLVAATVLPQGVRRTLAWEVAIYARPERDGRGRPVIEQVSSGTTFTVPLDVALDGPVRWTHALPGLSVTLRAELDLRGRAATLVATGPGGSTIDRSYTFDMALVEDDAAAYVTLIDWHDEVPTSDRGHELPADPPFAHLDIYPKALVQTPFAWTGGEGSFERIEPRDLAAP